MTDATNTGNGVVVSSPDAKPGVKTTEFWLTLGAQLPGLLLIFGFTPEQASDLANAAAQVGATLFSLVSLVAYIWSRVRVKAG